MKNCKDKPGVDSFDTRLLKMAVDPISPELTQIIFKILRAVNGHKLGSRKNNSTAETHETAFIWINHPIGLLPVLEKWWKQLYMSNLKAIYLLIT